ncbi:hypothetical protein FA13DRAFT_1800030 [Coprinellus micaceus]|uniref:Tyrosinase copper-binding domain-containing protein n=1 Tax=Coprinellus micaceus TaxID=71717 RepID=A0A4Y7SHY1_COPMI|nr:hypothetical protein FA13DRAFT_1800030 [Coprinellus micaceus]
MLAFASSKVHSSSRSGEPVTEHYLVRGLNKTVKRSMTSVPADPTFYLSHMNLDRMWWHWQKRDPKKRLQEVNGPTNQRGTENVTLDFVPDHALLGPNPTIREVTDIAKEPNRPTHNH